MDNNGQQWITMDNNGKHTKNFPKHSKAPNCHSHLHKVDQNHLVIFQKCAFNNILPFQFSGLNETLLWGFSGPKHVTFSSSSQLSQAKYILSHYIYVIFSFFL